jgi:imidazolonepropionase-like amidohydrolase
MRTLAVSILAILACSDPTRPPPVSPGEPAADPVAAPAPASSPPAQPVTVKRVVISSSRKSGTFSMTTAPDGTITTSLFVLQNGRGPRVEATYRLAADGTLASFSATGQHTMGTKVAETFTRTGELARWKSEEEAGDRTVKGPAMFVPMAAAPETIGTIVRAALRNGGTLPLLPAGEVRVAKLVEHSVGAGAATKQLTCYAITGLSLTPAYTWMNEDGTWFGSVQPWESIVPEGWESAIDPLIAVQTQLDRVRDAELVKQHAHAPPAAGLAYTHARVLDVAKRRWLTDYTVVVVADKITAVGPSKTTTVPKGAEVVDLAGKALVPGLIDMHAHLGGADGVLNIASGVTTVRDVGNNPDKLDDLKQRFDAGTAIGPHVVRWGFIEGRGEKAAGAEVTAETVEEATAAVELYAKRGYEGVKIYNSVKVELVPVIAKLAHAKGMQVTGHIPVHMVAHEAVTAGYDGVEHINMLFLNFFATKETDTRDTTRFTLVGDKGATLDLASKPVRDLFEMLRKRKTVIDPTLAAFEDLFAGVPGKVTPGLEDTVSRLPVQTQRGALLGGLPIDGDKRTKYLASWERILAMVKALHDAKIPVVLGTDHIAGVMFHHEMALFARAGIKPGDVLELATLGAARALKLDAKLGSIAKGKRADLVVVDGDPLADIRAIRSVVSTMRGGVVFESAPLYETVGVKPVAKAVAAAPSPCVPDEQFDKPTLPTAHTKDLGLGLQGKTAAQVVAARGAPTCQSSALWRYWIPRDCAYEKVVVSLWFTAGKVSRVTAVNKHTGEHCLPRPT